MSARSTQIFLHNETNFALTKLEEDLPHGEWGHDGGQRPPQSIAPNATAEMGSDSSGFLTGTEGSVRYRIEDGKSSSCYFHWDNPYSGTNKYHNLTDYDFDFFHSGGSGNNTVVNVFLRMSVFRSARNFKPSVNGFRFANSWPNTPYSLPPLKGSILDYKYGNAKNGLCGGMVNTSRDYFDSNSPVPPVTTPPTGEQDALFVYFVERLFDSFDVDDVTLYLKLMDPAYPDTDENILDPVGLADGRAFVMANIEWPLLRQDIDAGHPSPMGLVMIKSLLPFDLGSNHQVLAYAYQVHGSDVELWVYDPNSPMRDDIKLKFNIRTTAERIDVSHNVNVSAPIYCFFRTNYDYRRPPGVSGWNQFVLAPANSASTNSGIKAVARIPNSMEVWWIGNNGSVQDAFWYEGGQWQRFELASAGSASTNGGIRAVSRIPNSMEVWWIGANGSVQAAYWYEGGQWQRYELAPAGSAATNGDIAAVSRVPNSMEVWWIGPNGSVQAAFWYEGAQWNRYELAPSGSASPNGGVTATSRIYNSMEVWWIGADGSVQDGYWYEGAEWKRFAVAPPGSASPNGGITSVARIPNSMEIWWVGANGSIQDAYWYQGAQWNRFELAPAGSASVNGGVGSDSRVANSMEVWWIGPNGSIQDGFWYEGGQWQHFELAPPGSASLNGGVAAVSRIHNSMEVWWIGPDGSAKDAFWYA